jgi:hypothetical protein
MAPMAIRIVVVVVIALLLAAAVYLFVLRSPVEAPSALLAGVTIECDAWTGLSPTDCRAWGDDVLAAGPPTRTFNMSDLDRIAISRPILGLVDACRVAYYLGRHPTSPVSETEIACPGG